MDKRYITPQQLLRDAFALAWQVFQSGFRPTYVVGIWRGGTPVAIAVHELLQELGVEADHIAIRTRSYSGIDRREKEVAVDGLGYLLERLRREDSLLLVDDVHDSGLSLAQVVVQLRRGCGAAAPEIRTAVPYYKPARDRSGGRPDYFLHETAEWLVFPHELEGLTLAEMRANKPELADLLPAMAGLLRPGED